MLSCTVLNALHAVLNRWFCVTHKYEYDYDYDYNNNNNSNN
jgi:hypothetical protein